MLLDKQVLFTDFLLGSFGVIDSKMSICKKKQKLALNDTFAMFT